MPGTELLSELGITGVDVFALGFFVFAWIAYAWFSVRHGEDVPRLHSQMDQYRREWLMAMIEHDDSPTLKT